MKTYFDIDSIDRVVFYFIDEDGREKPIHFEIVPDEETNSRYVYRATFHKFYAGSLIDVNGYYDMQYFILRLMRRYVEIKPDYDRDTMQKEIIRRLLRNRYRVKF